MPMILVTDRSGKQHRLEATAGEPLMDALRAEGFVEALCGGNCACATCHVHIDPEWTARIGPAGEDEQVLLDYSMEKRPESRLSCQVRVDDWMEGLRLSVAAAEG